MFYLSLDSQRIIAVGLVVVLLFAFVAVPQAFAQAETGSYMDISVDEAYKMIEEDASVVVLDVRNQSEYNLGHLYNAVLIPVYELEERIDELQGHINDPIIVYCKAGSRSQIACEILASYGFTKVYNMLGGIIAWIEGDYPIYTTSHYVTVNMICGFINIEIEPMLILQVDLLPWVQNQASSKSFQCPLCDTGNNAIITIKNETVVLYSELVQEDAYHVIIREKAEYNGTEFEITLNITNLWFYNEPTQEKVEQPLSS